MTVQEMQALTSHPVQSFAVDPADFARFREQYVDPRQVNNQKYLEYYVAFKLFRFEPTSVYVDVASQDCPFHDFIASQNDGIETYRQDMFYLAGSADPRDLSGDACSLPLADGSVSHISLFNSFEHFEEQRDTAFIVEAQRVLRAGGELLIVPFEVGDQYVEDTESGYVDAEGVKHLWGIGARFSRTYDVQRFASRVVDAAPQLDLYVYQIPEPWTISSECYGQWFLVFRKRPA